MIYVTHDIDWLNPLHPYSIIKSIMPSRKWISMYQLGDSDLFLKQIEKIQKLNQSLNIKPTYFIGATHNQFGRYDLRYTLDSSKYNNLLYLLKNESIGLHSDLNNSISQQQIMLESATGKSIQFHRSHFLKHDNIRLEKELSKSSLQIDFSRGFARKPEHLSHKTFLGIQYIPTVLFDNSFFFHKPISIMESINYIFERIAFEQTKAAILFHPENMLIKPQLCDYYYSIIELIRKHGLPVFNENH